MRTQSLQFSSAFPDAQDITAVHGETLILSLAGAMAPEHVLTISETYGGAPLVEVPTSTGTLTLDPLLLAPLVEGKIYQYNLWARNGASLLQRGWGRFAIAESILPGGAEYPISFLDGLGQPGGPQAMVLLTRAQYDALPTPDPDTLYFIREVLM